MAERYTPRPPTYEIDLGVWDALKHPRGPHGWFIKTSSTSEARHDPESGSTYTRTHAIQDAFKLTISDGMTTAEHQHHEKMTESYSRHGRFETVAEAQAAMAHATTLMKTANDRIIKNGGKSDHKVMKQMEQAAALTSKAAVTFHHFQNPIEEPKKGVEKAVDILKDSGLTVLKTRAAEGLTALGALAGGIIGGHEQMRALMEHFVEHPVGDSIIAFVISSGLGFLAHYLHKRLGDAKDKALGLEPKIKHDEKKTTSPPPLQGLFDKKVTLK